MPWCIQVGWDDVPHLDAKAKAELYNSYLPHEREARTKGLPVIGIGKVFPVPESVYVCEPFEIPVYWPRAYGLDVGWDRTAAVWGAWDRASDTVYLYSMHYHGQAEPSIHADAIKARGDWIVGAIDPASAGSSQLDGRKLIDEYNKLGLNLVPADNSVQAGITAIYQRLAAGRLKIFSTLGALISEIRIYRREEYGDLGQVRIVKKEDHAIDAMRYLIMTGLFHARAEPMWTSQDEFAQVAGRSRVTGY